VTASDTASYNEPEVEEFEPSEWKLLFMVLCENRGQVELTKGLTHYGEYLMMSIQRKLGIMVAGVDTGTLAAPICGVCEQAFKAEAFEPGP
jgi:hypothetical protein